MKNKVNKYLSGGLLSLVCAMGVSQQASADIKCKHVTAYADLTLLSPVGPTVGTAYFTIGKKESVASVVVNFIAPPVVNPDGSQNIISRLDYDFGGGDTVVGIALGVIAPTAVPGVFSNDSKVTYVDGTGKYENVVSRIIAQGSVNFLVNTATQQGVGDICVANDKHEDED